MEEVKTTEQVVTKTANSDTPVFYKKKKVIFRTYQLVWYILGVIETLLAFRIFLKLSATNPASGFTGLVYTLSDPFALPFYGIFRQTAVSGSVLEWTSLLAMLVYIIIAYGLVELIKFLKPVSPEEVHEAVDHE